MDDVCMYVLEMSTQSWHNLAIGNAGTTIWTKLHNQAHLNLRLRLYKSSICSIMTYGSEAWMLNEATIKRLNGANAQMVNIITGKTPHQEASNK